MLLLQMTTTAMIMVMAGMVMEMNAMVMMPLAMFRGEGGDWGFLVARFV